MQSTIRHGLSADEARQLTDRVLGMSQADNARVSVNSGRFSFQAASNKRETA